MEVYHHPASAAFGNASSMQTKRGGSGVRLYVAGVTVVALLTVLHVAMFHEASSALGIKLPNWVGPDAAGQASAVTAKEDEAKLVYALQGEAEREAELESEPGGDVPKHGTRFESGSLKLSRTEAVSKCYVDKTRYHLDTNMCTKSEKYKVLYMMIPKSGSSTGRHVMKDTTAFEAVEEGPRACRTLWQDPSYLKTVTVRNPLSRFYASYDEAFVRKLEIQNAIPAQYRRFMEPFKGFHYKDYKALFDTEEGVRTLTNAFEIFVEDYDGRIVFDNHLNIQMPQLWDSRTDRMVHIDLAFDTHDLTTALTDLAAKVGAPKPVVIRGRSYPRRFNVTALQPRTLQKICRLAAIDFCCLNYELPRACRSADIAPGGRVMCEWIERPDHKLYIHDVLV